MNTQTLCSVGKMSGMLKVCLVLLSFSIFSSQATKYDLKQVHSLLDKNIGCLEKNFVLTANATKETAVTLGYLTSILYNYPNLPSDIKNDLTSLQSRLKVLTQRGFDTYIDDPARYAYLSEYWVNIVTPMQSNKLPKLPPLGKNYEEILNSSYRSEKFLSCLTDVFVDNPHSDNTRECQLRCFDDMMIKDYNVGVNPEEKIYYLAFALVNNCSNNLPLDEFDKLAAHFCGYTKIELDSMIREKDTKLYKETLYFPLTKLAFCGVWGFKDFLEEYLISPTIQQIDCNGCVGSYLGNEDEQVLTALTSTILTALYRSTVELEYPKN